MADVRWTATRIARRREDVEVDGVNGVRLLLLLAVLAAWMAAWVWVVRSSWLPALPGGVWLVLLLASALPLEWVYRRTRPVSS